MATQNESDAELDAAELVDTALPDHAGDLPPIDFSTFIVSLRASAMLHLGGGQSAVRQGGDRQGADRQGADRQGVADREVAADKSIDLALARQEIDLLGILEDKTRGNLTGEEERLLSQILFDLRTRYLAVWERTKAG